jgi:hypothetical protein
MGIELRLFGGNDSLVIEQDGSEDWYYCTVLVGARSFYLGAEVARCLFPRLLAAVSGELQGPESTIGKVMVRAALSLAEGHATLYVGKDEQHTLLFWEDEEGNLTAMMKLTNEDTTRWRCELQTATAQARM